MYKELKVVGRVLEGTGILLPAWLIVYDYLIRSQVGSADICYLIIGVAMFSLGIVVGSMSELMKNAKETRDLAMIIAKDVRKLTEAPVKEHPKTEDQKLVQKADEAKKNAAPVVKPKPVENKPIRQPAEKPAASEDIFQHEAPVMKTQTARQPSVSPYSELEEERPATVHRTQKVPDTGVKRADIKPVYASTAMKKAEQPRPVQPKPGIEMQPDDEELRFFFSRAGVDDYVPEKPHSEMAPARQMIQEPVVHRREADAYTSYERSAPAPEPQRRQTASNVNPYGSEEDMNEILRNLARVNKLKQKKGEPKIVRL